MDDIDSQARIDHSIFQSSQKMTVRKKKPTSDEIIDLFTVTGLAPSEAKMLVHLHGRESYCDDICKATGLSQPLVSTATRVLENRGWLSMNKRRPGGRGSPRKYYSLKISLGEIAQNLLEIHAQKLEAIHTNLDHLGELKEGLQPSVSGR